MGIDVLINTTPHPVVILQTTGKKITIPKSGKTIRLSTETINVISLELGKDRIQLTKTEYGQPEIILENGKRETLPEEKQGVYYIVSQLIKSWADKNGRADMLVPAEVVRDNIGNIIGCRSLGI